MAEPGPEEQNIPESAPDGVESSSYAWETDPRQADDASRVGEMQGITAEEPAEPTAEIGYIWEGMGDVPAAGSGSDPLPEGIGGADLEDDGDQLAIPEPRPEVLSDPASPPLEEPADLSAGARTGVRLDRPAGTAPDQAASPVADAATQSAPVRAPSAARRP